MQKENLNDTIKFLIKSDPFYYIRELILLLSTTIFMVVLNQYNHKLHEIQKNYDGIIIQSFYIIQEENYWTFLILGFIFIGVIIYITYLNYRACKIKLNFWIFLIVNVVFEIILFVLFSNPILVVFAVFLGGSLISLATKS